MDVCREIALFIGKEELFTANQPLVAAVSGGADSLCLLHCLHRLNYRPIMAHLDHQLREDSESEAQFVRQAAAQLGLECVTEKAEVAAFAEHGASLEEAARILRYRFLVRVARDYGVNAIATGHTADDQAETVLMHFLRGAGPSGLRGMLPRTSLSNWVGITGDGGDLSLVRPLLCLTHQQTVDYCEAQGLSPILDTSNLDPTYFRNRLRHELLPILESYNPEIRNVLNRTAQVMAAEAAWLADEVEGCWPSIVIPQGDRALALRTAAFLELPLALERAVMREMIYKLKPTLRDVGFEIVERACRFVRAKERGKRIYLAGNLVLTRFAETFLLFDADAEMEFSEYPQTVSESPGELPIPGRMELACGWALDAMQMSLTRDLRETIYSDESGRTAAMDASKVEIPLIVRDRKRGDRIRPLGMRGSLKVADLFVNCHIPRMVRNRWPLVVGGDQVFWVAGLRMSNDARITQQTKEIILLRLLDPFQDGGDSFAAER
jgi:tRNA(Ile)-lysidine synthase